MVSWTTHRKYDGAISNTTDQPEGRRNRLCIAFIIFYGHFNFSSLGSSIKYTLTRSVSWPISFPMASYHLFIFSNVMICIFLVQYCDDQKGCIYWLFFTNRGPILLGLQLIFHLPCSTVCTKTDYSPTGGQILLAFMADILFSLVNCCIFILHVQCIIFDSVNFTIHFVVI